jgi:predicted kinase
MNNPLAPDARRLILMVGLPRSGKSTTARALGFPIVCPDAIRITLYGERWRVEGERMVWTLAHYMVESLFEAGHTSVILDATNLTDDRRDEWHATRWVREFLEMETPVDVCIARALADNMPDLVPVIKRMAAGREPLPDHYQRYVP